MTGPEHYREAERELERAAEAGASDFEVQYHQARAQVHAALALAAATALGARSGQGREWADAPTAPAGMWPADFAAWDDAAGVQTDEYGS